MLTAETTPRSTITLPPVPAEFASDRVAAWHEPVGIDSYLPESPDIYPAFLDMRVYQGSSGRVFPLPFHERISQDKVPHAWDAVHLENEWVRLMILPELGGRIHVAYDKVVGYDFFYRNNVIKPALVGLAGPWISGGVEFNWPQHHRPATFLPTDTLIEREADGSITVWSSDHDPFARMKGMHGIRLRPDSAVVEARVRLFNRSEVTQSFLWWANVAAAVGDDYQSFFPTDVTHVADHARRAVTSFPRVEGRYYGVDYPAQVSAESPDADRLDWYHNIPVPTSYMVLSTDDEFFGGYDHGREAGFVHWASGDVSPGKKQWTWGNAEFGWAWDNNLTDGDGPYVELMAGVFTDNQPDFAWIAPGETKTFSQFWYPIQQIGPVAQATRDAAISLTRDGDVVRVGVAVTARTADATVTITSGDALLFQWAGALEPGSPLVLDSELPAGLPTDLTVTVTAGGRELARVEPRTATETTRTSATEPPAPAEVSAVEELVLIGQYLQQYRHATRSPEPYWLEALKRDPGNARAHLGLGARRYGAGLYTEALAHFDAAVEREGVWVPTPASGEALYRRGLTLVRLGRDDEARVAFGRAGWDTAWHPAAQLALARLHARAGRLELALDHTRAVLAIDADHLQAAGLAARLLRRLGREIEATELVDRTLERDPLDQWARDLAGLELSRDATMLLDLALEYATSGFPEDALRVLDVADLVAPERPVGQVEVRPLVAYHRAVILLGLGRRDDARVAAERATQVEGRYCLPSRLDDISALQTVVAEFGPDARALALLGHWYYDRGRRTEAIDVWSAALDAGAEGETAVIVHRNLGVAAYNVTGDHTRARDHYEAARALAPHDSKLLFERDQLAARLGEDSATRLARLEGDRALVAERDDLTVVYAHLLLDVGRAPEAYDVLVSRRFQPWEGGEGQVLGAWDRTALALAAAALAEGRPADARATLERTQTLPRSLGEARHPLANQAVLQLALGDALDALGDPAARDHWARAAHAEGDFTDMSTRPFSAQTYYSVLGLRRLGEWDAADALTTRLADYTEQLATTPATIDYFATSLPTMLLFIDSPQIARDREVEHLRHLLRQLATSARRDQAASNAVETGAEPWSEWYT